jgi:hypothetical protein
MHREGCARADGIGDLLSRRTGVADAGHYAFGGDGLNVTERLRPIGRQGYDPDLVAGSLLPAAEFVEVRRTDPAPRMCAAWAIVGRDMRTFHMEAIHGGAFAQPLLGAPQDQATLQMHALMKHTPAHARPHCC